MEGKKYRIILFQKNLRKPMTQFGKFLRSCEFVNLYPPIADSRTYKNLPAFEQEMERRKDGWINRIRRIFGIMNIWPKFISDGDLIFSYGYLLITNKPYCVYIENGLALYAWDRKIARHPFAKILFAFFVRRANLKKLIFLSKTAQKSFFNSADYSSATKKIIEKKSTFCYPAIDTPGTETPKKYDGDSIKFLYSGLFYMKGGTELVDAFKRIVEKYPKVTLTLITAKHILKKSDIERIEKVPQISLVDANLTEQQMNEMYRRHDVFLFPTMRDSLGVVLLEAISFSMPLVINDQYATHEFCIDGWNGFVNPDHPMKDYKPETYEMLGQYFNPKDFFAKLFRLQKEGKTKNVEDFIFNSIEKFILNPELIEEFSAHSLEHYRANFQYQKCADRIEAVFLEAIKS